MQRAQVERDGRAGTLGESEAGVTEVRRLAIFEDRYGTGAHERLVSLLQQPCMTFAAIAARFHVTRERVRQWHQLLMPGEPSGLERRKACGLYRQRKRLLEDPLFGAFYRHARQHLDAGRVMLITSGAGYRSRVVRIDGRLVAIREARRAVHARASSGRAYRLEKDSGGADLLYFRLSARDFLVVPSAALPDGRSTFSEGHPRYQQFKNTFAALSHRTRRAVAASPRASHV